MAYEDFINGYPSFKLARETCEKYLAYPVLSWRNLFIEMANQLSEFEESEAIEVAARQKTEGEILNKQKVTKLPNFTAELEGANIKIVAENVNFLTFKYYKVDLEVLFSVNPFTFAEGQAHAYVLPFFETVITMKMTQDVQVIQVPI